jgi:hypothetical protein
MRPQSRVLLLATLAVSAPCAAVGCGESAKPLTRLQLLHKGDAICRRVNQRLSSINIKSQQDLVRVLPQLATYEQRALAELSKLVPPVSMEGDWKTILDGAQTVADITAKLEESTKAKDLRAARTLIQEADKVQRRTTATAKRDGFRYCSQNA